MRKIDWIVIILILLLSLFTLKDLAKPGFFTSHDGPHQIVRFYYFDQALRDGQIPPRWAGGLLYGYGYPLFIFSYHLPWFISEIVHFLGLSIIDSVKATFFIAYFISGITMYIFQKESFGRFPAFVGTFLYLIAPFRFSNIFVRAASGDATAFIFPPLLFLALKKIKEKKALNPLWISIGAFSYAGLLLSHAMIFVLYSIVILLYILWNLLFGVQRNSLYQFTFVILFGLGLGSYYLIPSLVEKNITRFTHVMNMFFTGSTFVDLHSLIYSKWGYGMINAQEGGMSLQIGMAQWIVVIICSFYLIKKVVNRNILKNIQKNNEILFHFLLFIILIGSMLKISFPFWKLLSNIMVIDFTWRVLAIVIFVISILGGYIVKNSRFSFFMGMILIVIAIYTNRNHIHINQSLDWPLEFFLKLEKTTNTFDEYMPTWVNDSQISENKPKIMVGNKDSLINIKENRSNLLTFEVNTTEKDNVRINTIYYPGWEVYTDGVDMNVEKNPGNYMEFPVNKGSHTIIAQFKETPIRQISNFISLGSFGILIIALMKLKRV